MRKLLENLKNPVYSFSILFLLLAVLLPIAKASREADAVEIDVLDNTPGRIVLNCKPGKFILKKIPINGKEYTALSLGRESQIKMKGSPELPDICRSVIIPDTTAMSLKVLKAEYHDLPDIAIIPSKGVLSRKVNPADVPYTFGPAYKTDAFFPVEVASLREPYILRDHRGVVVELNPFRYNPVTRTLRVYTEITVELTPAGAGKTNILKRTGRRRANQVFNRIYSRHFLNYAPSRQYAPLDEYGELLVICHDTWLANIQPLVNHKNSLGIATTAVGVSTIGNDAVSIKNYIQSYYNTHDLAFVLLVGDAAEVASPRVIVGKEEGCADPTYALVAGADHYPDIIVGRFSAQESGQVDTQVQRTIEYELGSATTQPWYKKAAGIASDEASIESGIYDRVHMGYIRARLMMFRYTEVDEIYDPGATAIEVAAAVNAGRGLINYAGHGNEVEWDTSAFNKDDINALTNVNLLPFIFDVACDNGTFNEFTCFAEAWLRATHGSEPTGAVAIYASSIWQEWDPPMTAQNEFNDLLLAEAYSSFGAFCFASSCKMMDEYGEFGPKTFDTWHVFGDPTLRIVGTTGLPRVQIQSGDYDGDGTSDLAIFRGNSGLWAVKNITRVYFGSPPDIPVSGDYYGDGTSEIGIYRNSSGLWAIHENFRVCLNTPMDTPVARDYNGDGTCQIGIFRRENGFWSIRDEDEDDPEFYFGGPADTAVPGDYDGDGCCDAGIFRKESGLWAIRGVTRFYFGTSSDRALSGDYDGDGTWEAGIFRSSSCLWAVRGVTRVYFGNYHDQPVIGDFNGDSLDDIGIFRSSTGLWAVREISRAYFGGSGDLPVTR
jgi:gingipain R